MTEANATQTAANNPLHESGSNAPPEAQPAAGAPPTLPEASSAPAPAAERRRFEFTGEGSEYFKIWIVNVLLTIVTLGIYSAWAKVRRLRYFYNNTKFAGSTFDFHGSPIAILKGRVVAVVLILLIQIPVVGVVFLLLYFCVLPWLLYKAFQFKLANSSYRNLRFNFAGTARGAYKAIAVPLAILFGLALIGGLISAFAGNAGKVVGGVVMVIAILALYLISPYLQYRVYRYYVTGAEIGTSRFDFHVKGGEFYVPYVLAFAVMIGLSFFIGIAIALAAGIGIGISDLANMEEALENVGIGATIAIFVVLGIFYFSMLAVGPLIVSLIHNMVWRGTSLMQKKFHADLSVPRYVGVWMLVTFLTIITLGLYRPFAAVKLARMKVQATAWTGAADDLVALLRDGNQKATGSEVADLMNVDFGA